MLGGKRYALKDYPALHSPTYMISTLWAQSLHICVSVCEGPLPIPADPTTQTLHGSSLLTASGFKLYFFLVWRDTGQDLAKYIFKGGMGIKVVTVVELGGGAGYGAKWKHVTQGPLKCNPAQQKKGTHIIIKSSRGEAKTANIIPAPPPPTLLLFFSFRWQRRRDDWSYAVYAHCPRMTRRCLGTSWSCIGLYVFKSRHEENHTGTVCPSHFEFGLGNMLTVSKLPLSPYLRADRYISKITTTQSSIYSSNIPTLLWANASM